MFRLKASWDVAIASAGRRACLKAVESKFRELSVSVCSAPCFAFRSPTLLLEQSDRLNWPAGKNVGFCEEVLASKAICVIGP